MKQLLIQLEKMKDQIEDLETLIEKTQEENKELQRIIQDLKQFRIRSTRFCYVCQSGKRLRIFKNLSICNECLDRADKEYWNNASKSLEWRIIHA